METRNNGNIDNNREPRGGDGTRALRNVSRTDVTARNKTVAAGARRGYASCGRHARKCRRVTRQIPRLPGDPSRRKEAKQTGFPGPNESRMTVTGRVVTTGRPATTADRPPPPLPLPLTGDRPPLPLTGDRLPPYDGIGDHPAGRPSVRQSTSAVRPVRTCARAVSRQAALFSRQVRRHVRPPR